MKKVVMLFMLCFMMLSLFASGNCLDFDGTDDYVFTNLASSASSVLTVECMIYFKSLSGQQNMIHINDGGIRRRIVFYKDALNYINIFAADASDNADILGGSIAVESQKWYHLAFVYNNGVASIYVNGKLSATGNLDYSYSLDGSDRLYLAADFGYGFVSSIKMDEFRIWNSARSAIEIRENMFKTLNGNESGLYTYYKFDASSGISLQDYSGSGNNGTLNNMNNSDWVDSEAFTTWSGNVSTNWSEAGNWSDGVPVATDNVGIYGGGTHNPTINGTPTINNLALGSGSSIALSSGVNINGNLILESDIDLNGQTISLSSISTLIENSGKLYGSSGTITTTRNLSNIDEDVAGLGAQITEDGNLGSTTITRGHSLQGDLAIERYYQISSANSPSAATLKFHYRDDELNGNAENLLKLYKSADGTSWTEQVSSTVNTSDNTITLSGINSFSYWTASETGNETALPVELVSFESYVKTGSVVLNWQTASETNNAAFLVYRNDEVIARIEGAGTTSETNTYSYEDASVIPGVTYTYVLADLSFANDLVKHLEKEVSITISENNILQECILNDNYPNPFNPSTTISYQLAEAGYVEISIYDIVGKEIIKLVNEKASAGYHEVIWDASTYHSGVYFYRMESGGFVQTKKMIIMK